jgi:trehalose synthase
VIEDVSVPEGVRLADYAAYAHLAAAVEDLRQEATQLSKALAGRTVWMVNSAVKGGGVAEMLPRQVMLLNELGVRTRWVVIRTERNGFFELTKRVHNLIHGEGGETFSDADRALYETVSRELASELGPRLGPGDILVVHDPQPAGMGAHLKRNERIVSLWRCHIGLDRESAKTRAAWQFLEPYVSEYDHAVFTTTEYIPSFLTGRVTVITPAIDPLTDKNRRLSARHLSGVLCNSGLMREVSPIVRPRFTRGAERLGPDGEFEPAVARDELGLLFRPIVTQISRWDRLKGFKPLLDAFVKLKREHRNIRGQDEIQRRRFELCRLVLAGPEPAAVADDPEAVDVLDELIESYRALDPGLQRDVVVLSLPLSSVRENALMVNALQTCSSIVVQNSLQEGFGLTVTEPMWKAIPVLGAPACGIRHQIRDGIDGRLHHDANDPDVIASAVVEMLDSPSNREKWARQGQRRVHDEFLIFSQLRRWLRVLAASADASSLAPPRPSRFPPSVS